MVARLLNWVTFLVVIAAVWVLAGPTVLGGPASYVVVDGRSMLPTYEDGDLVIARQRGDYAVGDVVVYDAPIGSQFTVIHRVTEVVEGGFLTQGDNMEQPDGWVAPTDGVHGSAWFHIPNGGIVIAWLRQPAVAAGLAAGLVAFELAKRAERQRRDADGLTSEAPA